MRVQFSQPRMKISRNDYKFVPVDPDPGFSEEHNHRVIKGAIEATNKMAAKKRKEFEDNLGVRTSAIARFINRVKSGGGNSDIQGYFGKKVLEKLSGKTERSLDSLTVVDSNGQVIRRPGDAYAKTQS